MIVKKILIIDHNTGEAGEYRFEEGPNLLVSADNSQGKSSLLKTLYYGLGLDIKVFPADWDPSKMTIKLDLFNEATKKSLYVVRRNDLYYVTHIEGSISRSEYNEWLSGQLGVDIKLTNKSTQRLASVTSPSALITPFYVDQDESWSGRLFSTSNETNKYADVPKRILEYILKLTDDDELSLKEKISRLKTTKSSVSIKRENVNDVYMDYLEGSSSEPLKEITSLINPAESNRESIDNFIKLMDGANKKFIEQKALRIKLQRDFDQKSKAYEEYKSIQKMINSDYESIKCVCKNCKSELTQEQVKTRMEIDTSRYELSFLISTTNAELKALEKKLIDASKDEYKSSYEYEKLAEQVEVNQAISSIAEYIEATSKKKSQDEFASIILRLEGIIGKTEADIRELNKELRELEKSSTVHSQNIEKSYSDYVTDLSTIMSGSNVTNITFKSFKVPQSSGVNSNQAYLGAYLAYMKLISEYGRYTLPFCIDSFIKNETASIRSDVMFSATEKYLMNLRGQSIFSAIEESVQDYMKYTEKYNRVDIGNRLLSKDNFKSALLEIDDIVIVK